MAVKEKEGKPQRDVDLQSRWWVDHGNPREQVARPQDRETTVGASFFETAAGYNQEAARACLTDLNLRLLEEGNPPSDGWGYLQMTPDRFPGKTLEQIKRALPLPPGARALAVDSGVSLRVILTGQPTGERLLELRFGEESSFDAWVHGEWVGEALFPRLPEALTAAPAFVARYLGRPTQP
jgi:hypothetical protein